MNSLEFKNFIELERKFNLLKEAYIWRQKQIVEFLNQHNIPFTEISEVGLAINIANIPAELSEKYAAICSDTSIVDKAFEEAGIKKSS